MKAHSSNIDVIRHILNYCNDIEELVARFGKDFDTFLGDKAYFNAVSMCILQVGELSKHLSDDFIEATRGELPWPAIKSMRNLFAHNYLKMDKELIWTTAINDIPNVKTFCEEKISTFDLLHEQASEPDEDEDLDL